MDRQMSTRARRVTDAYPAQTAENTTGPSHRTNPGPLLPGTSEHRSGPGLYIEPWSTAVCVPVTVPIVGASDQPAGPMDSRPAIHKLADRRDPAMRSVARLARVTVAGSPILAGDNTTADIRAGSVVHPSPPATNRSRHEDRPR